MICFLQYALCKSYDICWARRYASATCLSLLFTKCCQSSKWAHSQMPSVPLEWLPPTWHRDKNPPCLVIQTKHTHTHKHVGITVLFCTFLKSIVYKSEASCLTNPWTFVYSRETLNWSHHSNHSQGCFLTSEWDYALLYWFYCFLEAHSQAVFVCKTNNDAFVTTWVFQNQTIQTWLKLPMANNGSTSCTKTSPPYTALKVDKLCSTRPSNKFSK